MKIIYKKGNLLDAEETYILHGCNAQGVMGAGVAKAIKEKWPGAYAAYKASEQYNGMRLGIVTYAWQGDGKMIFNGITQEFYGRDTTICYVSYCAVKEVMQGMDYIAQFLDEYTDNRGVPFIAMPLIGAGLGGGNWGMIEQIIEEESKHFQPVVYSL